MKVLIEDGQLIKVAIFLKGVPSEQFTEIVQFFIQEFEVEYREDLESWTGSLSVFKNAPQLIARHLFEKVGQILPQKERGCN